MKSFEQLPIEETFRREQGIKYESGDKQYGKGEERFSQMKISC